jgi:hypothetical protein
MTIKQQGGVFGRNPSFNDVEAENLEVKGDAQFVDVTATGDASFVDLSTTGDVLMQIQGASNPAVVRRVVSGNNWDTKFGGNTLYFTRNGANYVSAAGGSSSFLAFVTGSVGDPTSPAQAFLHADGRFEMLNNNIVMASGKGIDFSATAGTGTSELFDDYEEGTWTPVVGGTTSGTMSFATTNIARYTKIGRIVHITLTLTGGNFGTHNIVGNVIISGLPYTAAAVLSGVAAVTYCNLTTADEADITLSGYAEFTRISLTKGSSVSTWTGADLVSSGTNGAISLSLTYETGA